jgi:hypothetical protein
MTNDFGIQPIHVLSGLITMSFIVIGFLWRIARSLNNTNKVMMKFLQEHEMLIRDYCERHGIEVNDLPTRLKGLAG